MEDLLIDLKNGFLVGVAMDSRGALVLGDSGDEVVDLLCMYAQEVGSGNGIDVSVEGHEYPVYVSEDNSHCDFQVQCGVKLSDEASIRAMFETDSILTTDYYLDGDTMYFTLYTACTTPKELVII